MNRGRSLVGAAAAVAVAFVLAGCSLLGSPTNPPSPSASAGSAAPRVGDCWSTTATNASNWAEWKGAAAAPCSQTHFLYTFGVAKVSGFSSSDWGGNPVSTAASAACPNPDKTVLRGQRWNQLLIRSYFFIPSRAEWNAGARWVRCDLAVAAYGSRVRNPQFAALPSEITTLAAELRSDPKKYQYCIDTKSAHSAGPLDDPDAIIADCRGSNQWALQEHGRLAGAAKAPYPATSAVNRQVAAICHAHLAKGERFIAYYPQPAEWAEGQRIVDCWVTRSKPQDTIGGGIV